MGTEIDDDDDEQMKNERADTLPVFWGHGQDDQVIQ